MNSCEDLKSRVRIISSSEKKKKIIAVVGFFQWQEARIVKLNRNQSKTAHATNSDMYT